MSRRLERHNVWVLIYRAEDLPGAWIAHCLDFDIVTQGNSAQEAWEMVPEAIDIVLRGDFQAGRNPFSHRAPAEHWNRLYELFEKPKRTGPIANIFKHVDELSVIAAQMEVRLANAAPQTIKATPVGLASQEAA